MTSIERRIRRPVWTDPTVVAARADILAELDAIEARLPQSLCDPMLPPTGLCEFRWDNPYGTRWLCTRTHGHTGDCEARGRDGTVWASHRLAAELDEQGRHGCLDAGAR